MSRRVSPSLSVRPPPTPSLLPDRPPISALFLIDFDVKAGYTIVWKQAIAGLELEGTVEYKSLPSGLHTVEEDLIYFVHEDGYAGLSAFVNSRTEEEETRHARMIAVGVLVPLSYGRLGRAWRHAEALMDMAKKLVADKKQDKILDDYWAEHSKTDAKDSKKHQSLESPLSSPSVSFQSLPRPGATKGHSRKRSASDGAALIPPGHRLSPFHPAWSLTSLLDTFGPLIFPIHRAALLRKRILISTQAPVHEICNFVYDISILANIPLSVYDLLDPSAPVQRHRPLFTIGVHDIPFLVDDHEASKRANSTEHGAIEEDGPGWIACTTDSILAMKSDLWDVLITMPPIFAVNAKEKVWPSVESPKGVPVRATQRDMRRFRALKAGLARMDNPTAATTAAAAADESPTSEVATAVAPAPPPPRGRPSTSSGRSVFLDRDPWLADASEKVVEPMTWAALAYNGFMWWASAGEQRRTEETEETAQDASLLADLAAPTMPPQRAATAAAASTTTLPTAPGATSMMDSVFSLTARRTSFGGGGGGDGAVGGGEQTERAPKELAIIAYFHRLTTQMLSVLADIVESSDDDDDLTTSGEESDRSDEALVRPGSDENSGGRAGVRVDSDALTHMGLDMWSAADAHFVNDISMRYFARRAYVEGKGVEVCGMRIC